MSYSIEELNEVQKQAVCDTEGAVLVMAGAGSGKTRLLTHRIAHLIDLGVKPYNILAITFTNKAANEMRRRLDDMVDTNGLWIFTFHAMCARILRSNADKLGYSKSFTIYDENDQTSLIKRICKERDYTEENIVKQAQRVISDAKGRGIEPDNYTVYGESSEKLLEIYAVYNKMLKTSNAMDYDDLLINALKLLTDFDDVRDFYQNKFMYIHIDEFQDTNSIQYKIVKALSGKYRNIFAVGDEDQCIYTWRGATVKNVRDFCSDFECKTYKLEQNYRSTKNIIEIANRIIKHNDRNVDKELWTEFNEGDKVTMYPARDESSEADFVVRTIYNLAARGYRYNDMAVLLRLNAMTRPFEQKFMQYNIPDRVFGGFKFFDRKEVKDILAYLRVIVNPSDNEAFIRMLSFPKRGIGEATVGKLSNYCKLNDISMADAVISEDIKDAFDSKTSKKFETVGDTIKLMRAVARKKSLTDFMIYLTDEIIDISDVFGDNSDESQSRKANVDELIASVNEYERANPESDLEGYLQTVSLYSDLDGAKEDDDAVTIATIHSAKGLEFKVVFVVGLEESVFPIIRANTSSASEDMQEERRLMYVAVTRAREKLFLSYAESRFMYGTRTQHAPSRFLSEGGFIARAVDRQVTQSDFYGARAVTQGGGGNVSNVKKSSGEFEVGKKVRHKTFGIGTIISVGSGAGGVYATINFENFGKLTLAVNFAPLEIL